MLKYYIYDFFGANEQIFFAINELIRLPFASSILEFIAAPFFFAFLPLYIIFWTIYIFYHNYQLNPQITFEPYFNFSARITICYILFVLIYAGLKYSINLPRPFCSIANELLILSNKDYSTERCLSSFPSAHSGLALIIAYYLWPYLSKSVRFFSIFIVLFVGISRIAMSMHYPSDILYGYLIAFCTIIISEHIYKMIPLFLIDHVRSFVKLIMRFQ